jgi:hypothetical protein
LNGADPRGSTDWRHLVGLCVEQQPVKQTEHGQMVRYVL